MINSKNYIFYFLFIMNNQYPGFFFDIAMPRSNATSSESSSSLMFISSLVTPSNWPRRRQHRLTMSPQFIAFATMASPCLANVGGATSN
jgi:hypothetical protein